MKIIIIGGQGLIGKPVADHFAQKHEVLRVGRSSGDLRADLAKPESLKALFEKTGKVDAIISIAGEAKWAPFRELTEDDFYKGIQNKLMGQVNLVRYGLDYVHDAGSITLTTGILGEDPVPMTTCAALVNGGVHSFVKAIAMEPERGVRINVVAPGLLEEAAEKYADYFPGHLPVSMKKVISSYVRSVEGKVNAQLIRVYE